jgi:hypothetical protein
MIRVENYHVKLAQLGETQIESGDQEGSMDILSVLTTNCDEKIGNHHIAE